MSYLVSLVWLPQTTVETLAVGVKQNRVRAVLAAAAFERAE